MFFFTKAKKILTWAGRVTVATARGPLPRAPLTTFSLKNDDLGDKTGEELAQIFATIPASVTTLQLVDRWLRLKTAAVITQAFTRIPASVTTLDLSCNGLQFKTVEELIEIFAAIPASITTLQLRGNALGNKSGADLARIFAAIPAWVTTLDLSGNVLGRQTAPELAQAFSAIPKSVTKIDLSNNFLSIKTGSELVQILKAIPVSVTNIILDDDQITRLSQTSTEVRQDIAKTIAPENPNKIVENLRVSGAIMPGLFFYGLGLLARPAGFDKNKLEKAILCFSNGKAKYENGKAINLPEDVVRDKIGAFLAPVDIARLTMTCKPEV